MAEGAVELGRARPPAAQVSPRYRAYALGLLLAIYIVNFIDRQIVTILAEPIKYELRLADWQLGMITGLAFALFYTVLGIPIAKLADRHDRARIITASLAAWSVFTALCAGARSFTQLMALRVGVGVGEAGCSPAAHSLITDYVPKERRALALSVYALGNPAGVLVGLALGGLIAQTWGWRMAFIAAGVPGMVLSVIALFTLKDFRRAPETAAAAPGADLASILRKLRSRPSYWLTAFGIATSGFTLAALQAFAAPLFLRNHAAGLSVMAQRLGDQLNVHLAPIGFLGVALGLASGLAGVIGMLLGGVLSDRLGRRDARGYLVVPAVGALLATPLCAAACLAADPGLALLLWAVGSLLLMAQNGPVFAAIQTVAPPEGRAISAAILLFVINFFGVGFGPLVAGALSDVFDKSMGLGPAQGVRWSLAANCIMLPLSALLFWAARRSIVADSRGE